MKIIELISKLWNEFFSKIQPILATIVILAGLYFSYVGLMSEPIGDIPANTLVLIGEALTFSGSLLGVDYSYKWKKYQHDNPKDKQKDEE